LDGSTSKNIKLNDVHFSLNGDYFDKLFVNLGATSVFILLTKIAASFLLKSNMSLCDKIGNVVGTGGLSTATFHMVNSTKGTIKGNIIPQQGENSIILKIKDVVVSDGNTSISFILYISSNPVSLIQKLNFINNFIYNKNWRITIY